ncbi:MAG: TonB-dependent receptor [Pseudomonadota bacterium]
MKSAPHTVNVAKCFGACSALLLSSQLQAQPSTSSSENTDNRIEEVIVYGTKQGLTLQRVTDSVEVFSEDRLKEEVAFDIAQAVARAVNTTIRFNNLNNISVRGINRSGTNSAGQGDAINVYIDGVPSSSAALSEGGQSLWDIQQVEVLRGSQSTVQGRNAIAGAVVVESNSPTFVWEGAARVLAAEFGTHQYAGVVSGPLIEDVLAFRLSTDFQDTDGYTDYAIDGEDADYRESLSTRFSLLFQPSSLPKLRAELITQHVDRENGQSPGRVSAPLPANDPDFLSFDPSDFQTFREVLRFVEYETTRLTADLRYELSSAMTLKLLSTFEDVDVDGLNRSRAVSSFGDVGSFFISANETVTAELSLGFNFDHWTGQFGVYYFEEQRDATNGGTIIIADSFVFPVNPADSLAIFETDTDTKIQNAALFTQWRFQPNDRWAFDFGLRYDTEEFRTQRSDTVASILPANCMITINAEVPCDVAAQVFQRPGEPLQNDDYAVLLPRTAVTYNVFDNFAIFANIRRGYRAGGASLAPNDLGEVIVVTYEPEFLISYEAGWRSIWMDGRLTFNGTAFYSDYEDQQVMIQDSRDFSIIDNAGDTALYGLELALDFRVSESLSMFGNVGLLETSIDEFLFDAFTNPPVDLSGNELDNAPPFTATVGLSYAREQGFFSSLSLNYRSASWSDVFNLGPEELGAGVSEEIGSAVLVNARLGYRLNGITITGFATNLLDEDEPESLNFADSGVLNGSNGFRARGEYNMRQPQTFGISLEYAF